MILRYFGVTNARGGEEILQSTESDFHSVAKTFLQHGEQIQHFLEFTIPATKMLKKITFNNYKVQKF